MTINIALATYDGIILGCDSLSSVVDNVIYPFGQGVEFARDAAGDLILDQTGGPVVSVFGDHITELATTVIGGVRKMFYLYQDEDTCVAALTAGMATILDVTIAEHAKRFRKVHRRNAAIEEPVFTTTESIAEAFKVHMRALWERQYEAVKGDQRNYLPTVQFLVAGFGRDDAYGKIFKIDIGSNSIFEQFPNSDHMGICWAGQADYVERLIRGYDARVKAIANREMAEGLGAQRATTLQDITAAIQGAGINLPDDLRFEVTEHAPPTLPWECGHVDIDYGNLSMQYAVDLVEMLVNTQSGMQRFARGIPTVGGRTHIGVLKRDEGFRILNDPDLQHRHTGYGDEY